MTWRLVQISYNCTYVIITFVGSAVFDDRLESAFFQVSNLAVLILIVVWLSVVYVQACVLVGL